MASPFQDWVEARPAPAWPHLPLTHITRSVFAEKIMKSGQIDVSPPDKVGQFAYAFYGRPAYRANHDQIISVEGSCPVCFIFDPSILPTASRVHPFDSGAFAARLFNYILDEGMEIDDFLLDPDIDLVQRLIAATFPDQDAYFEADRSRVIDPELGSKAWELQARAFLALVSSRGRNEPDDRICSIEVCFKEPIPLTHLLAVIAPHTFWTPTDRNPHLERLHEKGVKIETYKFIPGRHPEQYQTLVEQATWAYYEREVLK